MTDSVFSTILPEGHDQGKIFAQPSSTPVDNSTANTINALGGLARTGTDAYKQKTQDATLKNIANEVAKNMAAVQQGRMKAADADIKNSALSTSAIVSNPLLAPEIKQTVIAVAGTDPTEAMYKQLNHARELEQLQQDSALNMQVQTAVAFGMPVLDSEGKLDVHATAQKGNMVLAHNYSLEQARLSKPAQPSKADADNSDEKALMNSSQDIFKGILDSSLSQHDLLLKQSSGLPKQEQLNLLASGVQQQQLAFNNLLEEQFNKAGASIEVRQKVRSYYQQPLEDLKKLATGELSDSANSARTLQAIQRNYAIPVAKITPLETGLSENFGGAAAALVVQKFATSNSFNDVNASDIQNAVNAPNPVRLGDPDIGDLQNKFNVLTGKHSYGQLTKDEQPAVLKAAIDVSKTTERQFDVLTAKQQENYIHSVSAVSQGNNGANDSNSQLQFAKYWNRQSFKDTLDKMVTRGVNVDKVSEVSSERNDYVIKTIKSLMKNDPNIKYDVKSDKTNSPLVNELIGNLNTFSKYDPKLNDEGILGVGSTSLEKTKEELFNVKLSPSSTE